MKYYKASAVVTDKFRRVTDTLEISRNIITYSVKDCYQDASDAFLALSTGNDRFERYGPVGVLLGEAASARRVNSFKHIDWENQDYKYSIEIQCFNTDWLPC